LGAPKLVAYVETLRIEDQCNYSQGNGMRNKGICFGLGRCMHVAILFLCLTVYKIVAADTPAQAAQPPPPPAALQPAQSSATPLPRDGISDHSLISPKGNNRADERANLEAIAKYAIDASRETTETVKWVFGTKAL
jgi:hypothetical protein